MAQQLGRQVEVDSILEFTTWDLLDRVTSDTDTRAALSEADAVLVTIGFNDTPWGRIDDPCHVAPEFPVVAWSDITQQCTNNVTRQYAKALDKVLDEIDRLHHGSEYLLRLPTVYNAVIGDHVDPGWDSPEAIGPSVRGNAAFAAAQCKAARKHGGRCAEMQPLMNGPDGRADAVAYLADHTHLNQAGHTLTADALAELGFD